MAGTRSLRGVVLGIAALAIVLLFPLLFLTCYGNNSKRDAERAAGGDTSVSDTSARNNGVSDTGANQQPLAGRVINRPGILVDPATAKPGERVGELAVNTIEATRSVVDSSLVGTMRFDGTMELSGAVMKHHDVDSRAVCFEADSTSAARMPRWSGDERRPWFCAVNTDEARSMIRNSAPGDSVRITITEFTINRGLSDQVNSARVVAAARR